MNLDTINIFVKAMGDVLMAELNSTIQRGQVSVQRTSEPMNEVTTIVSFTGMLNGMVVYSMAGETAIKIVSHMMGESFDILNELGQSGIAELSNVITGNAMTLLAQQGYLCDIAPPMMAVSQGRVTMSSLDLPRLVIPLETRFGTIDLHLAFKTRAA